jgi:hypothetical protein
VQCRPQQDEDVEQLVRPEHAGDEHRPAQELQQPAGGVRQAAFRAKLRLLHEEAGVPPLALKPAPPVPGPKKARRKK